MESGGLFWCGRGYDCRGENDLRGNDWGMVCGVLWTVLVWAGQRLWVEGERAGRTKKKGKASFWKAKNKKEKRFILIVRFVKNRLGELAN